ncbi:YbaB/EbfC family nucleoid-associated protein [Streptomyces pinistramenti]|uniref:YbaB/EbfC family nucleoid-associated protein n=1 Tax=Streptomyces pinistramenti TaxID=2884812 RepID=UPI001D076C3E|nr:YbaB/EbfC family nucleoid-associated protein [Streptomyces pinistramenti]MCB5906945.1 YbaB/EbfC family nucleoid-associated protein [Streptomyces pinistramenti]
MPDPIDFAALTDRMRHLQGHLSGLSENLSANQATGHGGGGLVTATVTGEGRLTSLRIDPSVVDPDDTETLAGLVIQAVDAAQLSVKEMHSERVGEFTEGLTNLAAGLREHTEQSRLNRPTGPAPDRPASSTAAPDTSAPSQDGSAPR